MRERELIIKYGITQEQGAQKSAPQGKGAQKSAPQEQGGHGDDSLESRGQVGHGADLLLQYVVFPYGDTLRTELWVEPQYGVVCDTPPGLQYLQGLTHSQISPRVCTHGR